MPKADVLAILEADDPRKISRKVILAKITNTVVL